MSLIPSAFAAGAAAPTAGGFNVMSFLPMIVIFVLFWFLLIRPQQKKAKLQSQMIAELQKGDEVVTTGGIFGKIAKVVDQFILLEVADNVTITVQKSIVAGKVEKGTIPASNHGFPTSGILLTISPHSSHLIFTSSIQGL